VANGTLWDQVDEPVLRWVASLPPSLEMELHEFQLRESEPFAPIEGLDTRDVRESLHRLRSHGLIAGDESLSTHDETWHKLRVTAFGLVVLGEWPDLDRVATAASIHRLLRALADEAPEQERTALVRAAGVVSRTADEVVRGTAADIARTIGREAAGERPFGSGATFLSSKRSPRATMSTFATVSST
jgi:hypothetical protein